MNPRVPPQSLQAERAVLGGVMLDNSAYDEVADILDRADFYSEANARVWSCMVELRSRGEPIDSLTLRERLVARGALAAVGGDEYLVEIGAVPTVANIAAHASIVHNLARVRNMILACHDIAAQGYGQLDDVDAYLDDAAKRVCDVLDAGIRRVSGATLREAAQREWTALEQAARTGKARIGISTSITDLDELTGGFQRTDLWFLAGRPGMGKSALGFQILRHVAEHEGPAIGFSLEMSVSQVAQRELSSSGRIDNTRIRQAQLWKEDWGKLARALTAIPSNLFIDDTSASTPTQIRSRARRFKREHGDLALVVVDYLQIMGADAKYENRNLEVAAISKSMKALAKDLNCAVLVLSQLNRDVEKRKNRRPMLSDLRDSGAVEQDADGVMFVYRPEVYSKKLEHRNRAEIIVGKARHSSPGTAHVAYFGEYTRFDNLAQDEYPDPADYQDGPTRQGDLYDLDRIRAEQEGKDA